MIVYIADRTNHIIAAPSTEILSDSFTDEVQSGIKTVELSFVRDPELEASLICGNYLLYGGSNPLLYQATQIEKDAKGKTIRVYGEDAGIDLLSKVLPDWNASATQTLEAAVNQCVGGLGWTVNYVADKTKTRSKDNFQFIEETALARLQSVVSIFDCEMYFSYEVNGLKMVDRFINIVPKRGSAEAVHTFRMGHEIENIIETSGIEELATSYIVTGTKALSSLSGYSGFKDQYIEPNDSRFTFDRKYRYYVTGNEVRAVEPMEYWKNTLDTDGLITVPKKYESANTAQRAISEAMQGLENKAMPVKTYDVTFVSLPDGVSAGDYIRIVDEDNKVYLESRILKIEQSHIGQTCNIELGDFTEIKGSKAKVESHEFYTIDILSSNGLIGTGTISTVLTVNLYINGIRINDASELETGQRLIWSVDGTDVASSDSRISDDGFKFIVTEQTGNKTYACRLIKEV